MNAVIVPLFAVHIADMVLSRPWVAGGWIGAALLIFWGAWRIREEEIPRTALLTAAFFVASSMHVPLGISSAHLLLNGFLGVVLGRRAALAIPIGVFMQAVLLRHGGFSTIGLNSCIMVLPALVAGPLFHTLKTIPAVRRPWFRAALVGLSAVVLIVSLVNAAALLYTKSLSDSGAMDHRFANSVTLDPVTLFVAVVLGAVAALVEKRMDNAPEFPLGLLVGELSVLATVFVHFVVLVAGGVSDWEYWALIDVIVHLPIAVIEGVVLGFTVGFLVRVKPELLAWPEPEKEEPCVADPVA
jgi:cobalt/nickel transport system permease protein